jgi:2,3-diketo-5-methylthiopentyl-1-phosphate enolase
MKPSIGLTPAKTAEIAAAVARGGIDLVKDDEVLADTQFSPVADRVRAVKRALDDVADETGHRARYLASITGRHASMSRNAELAVDAGADGLMVAALATGLDSFQQLVEQVDGRVPILAHTASIDASSGGEGLGIAPELLVGMCRLAGADGVLIGSPWARRATPVDVWRRMAARLREPWISVDRAFPVVGGGVIAEQLDDIVTHMGRDVIITAGGSVNGHPDGAEAGARELRAALDAALAGAAA